MTQLSYAAAGVSIDAGDELVERIKPAAKRTLVPGVLGSIGGFGALFEVSKEYKNPVLVTGTDGVGTKLMLAFRLGRHDTVGQDLVAMSVNDILVQGAKSLFFLDYYACGKLDVDVAARVVAGAESIDDNVEAPFPVSLPAMIFEPIFAANNFAVDSKASEAFCNHASDKFGRIESAALLYRRKHHNSLARRNLEGLVDHVGDAVRTQRQAVRRTMRLSGPSVEEAKIVRRFREAPYA